MAGSLDGVLIADFSRVLAGPYATMILADHGAEVIKVESPDGDATRGWGPPFTAAGQTTYFTSVNRNKRSVVLDLTDPTDVELAVRLAAHADVVIENLLPGKLAELGVGYDAVRARNPEVIYCSITGFGSGAGAQLPGYDLLVQAMGGLMSVTGIDEPTRAGVAVVDVLTGLHATVGILAALHHRDRTGEGQAIEVSLLGSLLSSLVNQSAAYASGGQVPGLMGNAHPSIAPYQVFAAADRPMVVAVGTDRQFRRLADEVGLPELAGDQRFVNNVSRVQHRVELNGALAPALAGDTAANWARRLSGVGVPCGPVNGMDEAFALATELGLAPLPEIDSPDGPGSATVANPLTLGRTPATYRLPAPELDADGDAVRRWLQGLG